MRSLKLLQERKRSARKLQNKASQSQNLPLNERPFLAIDGEAIKQSYVLLGGYNASGGKSLFNKKGLRWKQVFDWLLAFRQQYILVMFAGHYDVNMWCRSLPVGIRDSIFSAELTVYKDYEILYIPKKFLRLKRNNKTITVYDSFSFFNCSFVDATKKILGRTPKIITEQKKKRAEFTMKQIKTIENYNRLECILLCEMMDKLRSWIQPVGLKMRGWYGPSGLANTFLSKHKVNEDFPNFKFAKDTFSEELFDAFKRAYFGGRIEAFNLGTVSNVYQYDINSAYPFSMTFLQPTLVEWLHTKKFKPEYTVALYRVCWNLQSSSIGLFPFRDHNKGIYFPRTGEGWYWYPEIAFAVKHFPNEIKIIEGYYQCNVGASQLCSLVSRLYDTRLEYKETKNPTEYVIKIMMNSLYGKFAQTVGKPRFTNMVWAGYITSYTRAQLLNAAYPHFDSVIAFSTDGILTTKQLTLPESKMLGDYSSALFDKVTVFMPGVYQLFKDDKSAVYRRRGYRVLKYKDLIKGLNRSKTVTIPVRIFVTHNLWRAQSNVLKNFFCHFIDITKEFNPYSNRKRAYDFDKIFDWSLDSCGSQMIQSCQSKMSEPYEPFQEFEENVSEDDL